MAKTKGAGSFHHESLQDSASIAAYLAALQEGFESGTLTLSDASGVMELEPTGLLRFEVRAQRNRERVKMTLRLSWKTDVPSADTGPLRISSSGED